MQDKSYNIFTEKEAPFQLWYQAWRGRMLAPFLRFCVWAGITPLTLSLCGLLSMFLLPLSFLYAPAWVLVAYGLHVFFDGVDGALARHMKVDSARGSYVDIVVDHLALMVTVLTLQWFGVGDPFWVLLFTSTYLLLIVHLLILNVRGMPPPIPVIRSRYLMFLVVILLQFGAITEAHLDMFFFVAGIYHAAILFAYFFLLGWSLPS